MTIHLDHSEPPAIPDQNPNRPSKRPPAPAPDVVPVRDPALREHPDPIKEPPSHEPKLRIHGDGGVTRWRCVAKPACTRVSCRC